jgi:acyl-coenzyme A synthetase/AMP-(fatty) acid ligase
MDLKERKPEMDLKERKPEMDLKERKPEMDLKDGPSAIMFSSGTTGAPKAIPYSHAMIWDRAMISKLSEV